MKRYTLNYLVFNQIDFTNIFNQNVIMLNMYFMPFFLLSVTQFGPKMFIFVKNIGTYRKLLCHSV